MYSKNVGYFSLFLGIYEQNHLIHIYLQGQLEPDSEDAPRLKYEITSDDGFYVLADTMDKAWKAVTDTVQDARSNARMKQLSYASKLIGHDYTCN